MFLVKDRRLGMDRFVFTHTDPRTEGCKAEVINDITLDYDMNAINLWPNGQPRPKPQLGRDPKNPHYYKVFKFPEELRAAGFELIQANVPFVVYSWSDYRNHYYPVPEEYAKTMTQDEWFDFLEDADFAARIRRTMGEPNKPTQSSSRDQVAEWVVDRHMGADGGILQVWYLRSGSPADEIRLLEVSERFTGQATQIEPIDFGLDIEGAKYKLLVADVSGEQLERIMTDPAKSLPNDWKIDDALIWGRRGTSAMNEKQRLFLVQAKSAYAVYRLLNADKSLHHCHALHYLQMATELLGKASAWKSGPIAKSHKALVPFLHSLSSNTKAQKQLGYEGQNENWKHTIRKIKPIASRLQELSPDLAGNGPNPEYPWPPAAPTETPVEYAFPIWDELTETSYGRTLISLIHHLFGLAEEYM